VKKPFCSAAAPPLRIPASSSPVIRPSPLAEAPTSSGAAAMPRFNAVMSAASVTVDAPMRRSASQAKLNEAGDRPRQRFGTPDG